MAEAKTRPTSVSPAAFVKAIEDPDRRRDCRALMKMMKAITGKNPKMWGPSIIGYGTYHYKYASGREGDFMVTGFSPRKRDLTVYIMPGFTPFSALMKKLGKYKTGKSCLYLKRLDDVDTDILHELVERSVDVMQDRYPCS